MISADKHETEALRLLEAGSYEAAQVRATLAVSARLADLRRDRVDAAMLIEPASARRDRGKPGPVTHDGFGPMTQAARRQRGESRE